MVQIPKERVREGFVAAAGRAFVELGYEATSMAAVAERAGSSVGNLYKYFSSKQQLFDAVVPAEVVAQLERRTRARVRALGRARDVSELGPGASYHALAGELLDYCLAHRAAVIVVLARADGTAYADFRPRFVASLAQWALAYARAAYPELVVTEALRFVLRHAYDSFVSGVAEVLMRFPEDARARELVALVTLQHQGGLKRLFEACTGEIHAELDPPSSKDLAGPAGAHPRDAAAAGAGARPARPRPGQADRARRPRRRR